jgi:copper chaperone CopZ
MIRILFFPMVLCLLISCGGGEAAVATRVSLQIDGMTCERCEAAVQEALEGMDGVKVITVSAADGNAIIETTRAHTESDYRSVLSPEGKALKKVSYP